MTDHASRRTPAAATPRATSSGTPKTAARGRALAFGVAVAIAVAVVWALLYGLFDVTAGLLAVAAVGGWLIGASVRHGAWGGAAHEPDARLRAAAAVLGGGAWLVGSFLAYVVSLLTRIPESQASLAQRMANVPFPQFVAEQQGAIAVVQLALLVLLAWRAAR